MPVKLALKAEPVVYKNESGLALYFSPVNSIEAQAHKSATFGGMLKMVQGEELGFDELYKIGLQPIELCARHLERITGVEIEGSEETELSVNDAEQAKAILVSLVGMEGYEDLLPFLKVLADGQKKTLLTI